MMKKQSTWMLALGVIAAMVIGGTIARADDSPQTDGREQTRQKARDDRKPDGREGGREKTAARAGTWSIILASFRGPEQAQLAEMGVKRVRDEAKISDVFAEVRGPATVVAIGRYADPGSPEAVRRLADVRETRVGGGRPFIAAFLAPPGDVANVGSRPEYNLLKAREEFGERCKYTLQVAVYGREDLMQGKSGRDPTESELAESRKAAEDAAAKLRQEGELAFYFHGPRRSMVTIGMWNDDDLGSRGSETELPREENPELVALRKRFPQNLYNGAAIRERSKFDPTGKGSMQASSLVKVPER